jgi:hypothetical protein
LQLSTPRSVRPAPKNGPVAEMLKNALQRVVCNGRPDRLSISRRTVRNGQFGDRCTRALLQPPQMPHIVCKSP